MTQGLTAADFAGAKIGAKTLLVDQSNPGGDCTWSGCVPSKAFIHAAADNRVLAKAANLKNVHDFVQGTIQKIYALETPEAIKAKGIDWAEGKVEFLDKNTITITGDGKEPRRVSADYFVVCTGAEPRYPTSIEGFDGIEAKFDYQQVWHLTELPKRLAVVGTGPIGAELGQAFARLGSEVTMIGSTLLPREIEAARTAVLESFKADGIQFAASRILRRLSSDF